MPWSKPRCTSILYQEGTYFFILETEYERQWIAIFCITMEVPKDADWM